MASRIVGIDLGAYSVKVAVANPGFRQAGITDFEERLVPPGDQPETVRAMRVLGEILRQKQLTGESPFAAVSGDKVFIHILEFSFRSLKRAELAKVVGAELEDILPIDLEDMVFSFDNLPAKLTEDRVEEAPPELGDGFDDDGPTKVAAPPGPAVVRGRVAEPTEGMRVLACAMRQDKARDLLQQLAEQGADARGLVAAPASYMRVAERIGGLLEGSSGPPVAIIDVGHARTDICVIKDGRMVFARTLPRAGRDITEAIARTWRLSYEEAERAKHSEGFVASSMDPADSEGWQRVHDVVVTEVGPLARDIKQTLSACRAKTGATVSRVELVGGGSRLRGLAGFLGDKLRIPVSVLDQEDNERILGAKLASMGLSADIACLAAGVAFEGASGRPTFDLRQGALAFKADLSFLRAKAAKLAAAVLVVIAFAALNAYSALHKLRKAEATLDERLAVETTAAFGEALSAGDTLMRVDEEGPGAATPVPKMTAYDILLDINDRLPTAKEVKIDVTDVDIKPGRITMKVITGANDKNDSVKASVEVINKLKTQTCFEDVSRGNLSSGANETSSFPVTIKANCR